MFHRQWYAYRFACFHCRKSFARERKLYIAAYKPSNNSGQRTRPSAWLPQLTATCPECGGPMYNVGIRFKAPPRQKKQLWLELESKYKGAYAAALQRVQVNLDKIDPYFSKGGG